MQQKTRAGPGVFRNENDMISAEKSPDARILPENAKASLRFGGKFIKSSHIGNFLLQESKTFSIIVFAL